MRPIERPRSMNPAEEGRYSLLPDRRLTWLRGGFCVLCCLCNRVLTPIPSVQDPERVCYCGKQHRFIPAVIRDNRSNVSMNEREPLAWTVWDAVIENAVTNGRGAPQHFGGPKEARQAALAMEGTR